MTEDVPIKDAATVVVVRRDGPEGPAVLMGQRGAKAAFMPNKFVFPGGAMDQGDLTVPLATPLSRRSADAIALECDTARIPGLPVAAIRELWEETGQVLGHAANWLAPSEDWASYAATGHQPAADQLEFIFRAITPPGRPRRFDARFFLTEASELRSDPDDFTAASDELSHLQWVPLTRARELNLPFITEVVLAEVGQILTRGLPDTVPFFKNDDEESLLMRLGGRAI